MTALARGRALDPNSIVEAFETLGGDPSDAVNAASAFSSPQTWIAWQSSQVAASGAAATAVPGLHLLTMSADVAFVVHKVAYCAWGVGALHRCRVDGEDDLAIILALWAGTVRDEDLAAVVGEAAASRSMVGAIGTAGAGMAGKAIAQFAATNPKLVGKGLGMFGPMVVKKVVGHSVPPGTVTASKFLVKKLAPKLAPKLGTKVGTKGLAGLVPFVGPAVSASVNAYIIGHTGEIAGRYYGYKKQFEEVVAAG